YLRQVGGMQGMFQYPDTLTNQLLYGGGFRGQTPNQYGNSQAELLMGLLGQLGGTGGIDWSGIASGIGGLFGGGTGTSEATVNPDTGTVNRDGQRMGYDATSTGGPGGYWDTSWYNNALTNAQNAATQQALSNAKGPNTTLPMILGLLMQLLPKK